MLPAGSMNRRILLIDADPAFHASMTKQLARFRFDIVHEPDGERAHAAASAELPALLIVAVEEPEKAGFKLFQKLRKGPTAKVPIMLVTSSMTTESFAKHKALKVHADDYLDKRTQADELLGKLEQLIGLGDPIEDDFDIPLEVDEIPLAEGDMVLEETIGDDDIQDVQEFEDPHNAGTRNMAVDKLVDAEIDAGFAAMFGDDDVPVLTPVTAVEPALEQAPASGDGDEDSKVRTPIDISNESVPVPIADGSRHDDEAFDSFEEEPARPPSGSRAPVAIDDDVAINSRDMIPIEELAAQADAEEEERSESTQVEALPLKQPAKPAKSTYAAATEAPTRAAAPLDNDAANEFSQHDMVTRAAPVNQKLLEELSIPVAVAHVNRPTGETMAPPIANMAAIDPPTAPPSVLAAREAARSRSPSMQPIVDLGLDEIAVRAESEQSGVHDRRSLQKVGELERQLAQLKTELERARSQPAQPASRANDFVKLREQITQRDTELQKAKDELAARDREIKDAQEKVRQAQHARGSLEGKASELEQRHTTAQTQIATLESREKALGNQVAALKDELEQRSVAATQAEATRAQIERDLAAERARAAAGASDAERSLRVEREQLIARHQGELAGARGEAEKLREAALASQKADLEAEHGKALAAATEAAKKAAKAEHDKAKIQIAATHAGELETLKQQYGGELEALEKEHADALANARGELEAAGRQHAAALAAAGAGTESLAKQHADALAQQAQAHAEELETARAGHAAVVAQHAEATAKLVAEHAQQLADHGEEQAIVAAAELARVTKEHEAALAAAAKTTQQATASLTGELEAARAQHAAELDKVRAEADKALQAKTHAHGAELDKLRAAAEAARTESDKTLVAKTSDHVAQMEALRSKHAEAIESARAELERQAAEQRSVLDTTRKEHDALLAKHEAAKAELVEGHRRATEALAAAHAEQLAKVTEDKQQAIDDIKKAAADHRAASDRAQQQADEQLASQRANADRESAEHRAALTAVKRAADEAAAKHQAEREAAQAAHDKALADQKAQHERALAVANGELVKQKAVGDADHNKALAAIKDDGEKQRAELVANHERAVAELHREREELQKGLSGARETNKRIHGELATAVQTIADRNAELRAHTAAIAERDQRLAELRKEIDSLEAENASYQEQVLRAYQKIKTDEAMVARAKKAMAIALTVLDDQGNPS